MNDGMAYFLRVNISNQGLNDSSYERTFSFNMGKFITLKKVFYQDEISSKNIMDDSKNFKSAEMDYIGSKNKFIYIFHLFE